MKFSLIRKIDEFCDKHPNFGIRNLMMYIVAGHILVYVFAMMQPSGGILSYIYFNLDLILKGQIWRLFSYLFIPASWGMFSFLIELYFYYFIGQILENAWGTAKFNVFYLIGVLLSTLYGIIVSLVSGGGYIGLSSVFLNFSMMFVYATMYPDNVVLLFFIIPIKMKYFALGTAIFFAFNIISLPFPTNFSPLIAILNYLIFCGGDLWYQIKGVSRASKMKYSKSSSNFREQARKAKKEVDNQPYRHKCCVCGKTDADYPDMQFRYCSKCAGYHCFCEDHINSHIHFTE